MIKEEEIDLVIEIVLEHTRIDGVPDYDGNAYPYIKDREGLREELKSVLKS